MNSTTTSKVGNNETGFRIKVAMLINGVWGAVPTTDYFKQIVPAYRRALSTRSKLEKETPDAKVVVCIELVRGEDEFEYTDPSDKPIFNHKGEKLNATIDEDIADIQKQIHDCVGDKENMIFSDYVDRLAMLNEKLNKTKGLKKAIEEAKSMESKNE